MRILAVVALLVPATAFAWPGDGNWEGLSVSGMPLSDSADDMLDYNAPSYLDLVGDAVASDPVGFWYVDEADLYFRIRVDADPSGGDFLDEGAWVVLLNTDSDLGTYEYSIAFSSAGSSGGTSAIEVYSNAQQDGGADDPAENLLWQTPRNGDESIARLLVADSGISLNDDYFLDLTIPWETLVSTTSSSFSDETAFRVTLATAEDEGDAAAVDVDLAGVSGASSMSGLSGAWSSALAVDGDGDGLLYFDERELGTDVWDADTDDDGLTDWEEVSTWASDPLVCDTDGDGLPDGLEVGREFPNVDTDLSEGCFYSDQDPDSTTDYTLEDTDTDTREDGVEDANQNGRVDAWESDPNVFDVDSDGDGIVDSIEEQCDEEAGTSTDQDGDGVDDIDEGVDFYGYLIDSNGDGLPDFCDPESDGQSSPDTGDDDQDDNDDDDDDDDDVIGEDTGTDDGQGGELDTGGLISEECLVPFVCEGRLTGGSCSSAPLSATLVPSLIALLGVLRRRWAVLPIAGAVVLPNSAGAAGLNAQLFTPAMDGYTFTHIDDTTIGLKGFGGGLMFNYSDEPLVFRLEEATENFEAGEEVVLLSRVATFDLMSTYSWKSYRVGVDVPLNPVVDGYQLDGGFSFGDIALDGMKELVDRRTRPLGVGVGLRTTLPSGNEMAWVGAQRATVGARVALATGQDVVTSLNLGYQSGSAMVDDGFELRGHLNSALGVSVPISNQTWISAETLSRYYLAASDPVERFAAEALASLHVNPYDGLVFTMGGGTGISQGVGAPDFRVVAGLVWAPQKAMRMSMTTSGPDMDRDGIPDDRDKCPDQAEDYNGVDDGDGCPDGNWTPSNLYVVDHRGAQVAGARLELLSGPVTGDWATEAGALIRSLLPGDYVVEVAADGYTSVTESLVVPQGTRFEHRFHVEPGDAQAGRVLVNIMDVGGMPVTATVRVLGDNGRSLDEASNGVVDDALPSGSHELLISAQGFQTERRMVTLRPGGESMLDVVLRASRVEVSGDRINVYDKIFFELASHVIKRESFLILDEIILALKNNPSVNLIEIQGHTDSQGGGLYNLELSQRRADSVRQYLIEGGVSADRLIARGYGESVPLTSSGMSANRRVEFHIVR